MYQVTKGQPRKGYVARKRKTDDIWNIKKYGRLRGSGVICRLLTRKGGKWRGRINEELTIDKNIF